MSEVVPLAERKGVFDLFDPNGSFVGKANVGARIMLADGFYVPERACYMAERARETAIVDCYRCSACGETAGLEHFPSFYPNCGAHVIEGEL